MAGVFAGVGAVTSIFLGYYWLETPGSDWIDLFNGFIAVGAGWFGGLASWKMHEAAQMVLNRLDHPLSTTPE